MRTPEHIPETSRITMNRSTPLATLPALSLARRRWLQAMSVLLLGAAAAVVAPPARAAADSTVIEAVQLPARVERLGQSRAAEPGAVLRAGDKAVTAADARMLLRMSDRSTIRLGESSEFLVQTLERTPQDGASHLRTGFKLITGVFRYATDYSSKAVGNKTELNLELATATVGIRGTDFWAMTDADHDAVCVFEGHVAVERGAKPTIDLQKPGAFWVVFTNQPEKPAGQATPDQLAKFIGQAEMKPGSGVLLQGGQWRLVAASGASGTDAGALRDRLQAAGYPARVVSQGKGFEVRINQFASEQDAQTVLAKLAPMGVTQGRVVRAR
jgi:hypothetical protein